LWQLDRTSARLHEHELKAANLQRQIDELKRTVDEQQVGLWPPRASVPPWHRPARQTHLVQRRLLRRRCRLRFRALACVVAPRTCAALRLAPSWH
jgi:hypothetical protein